MKLRPILQKTDKKREEYKVESILRVRMTRNHSYNESRNLEEKRELSENEYESYFGQSKEGESKKLEKPSIIRSDNKQYIGNSSVRK